MEVNNVSKFTPAHVQTRPRAARVEAIPANQHHRPSVADPVAAIPAAGTTDTRASLSIDDATGRIIGRVIDRRTGEIVRQTPSEEVLRIYQAAQPQAKSSLIVKV